MVTIPLGTNDLESASQDVVRIKSRNMYLIENPTSIDGYSRVSRPTLRTVATIGSGPINGVWRSDGCLNGLILVVSQNTLYSLTSLGAAPVVVGNIPGTGYAIFAGSTDRALVCRDGLAYFTDGVTLTQVTIPDNRQVAGVSYIDGLFILTVKGEELFYWIQPEETDPDPLNFASAERYSDDLQGVATISDEIWFFGDNNEEVWQFTGDENAPLSRITGRAYSNGCLDSRCIVTTSLNGIPCVLWVTRQGTVMLAQGVPNKVSNESVDELLRSATNPRAWGFNYNRHSFYVLTTDQFTVCYDLVTGTWSRWDSFQEVNWKAHLGNQLDSIVFAGSCTDNSLYVLEEGVADDNDPVIREIQGSIPVTGRNEKCAVVSCRVNSGWSPVYGFEPVLELRFSDDQRGTWSPYFQCKLGDKGQYNTEVLFRSLGLLSRPGRDFEFRFSEKARFRIDYATMNEAF